jgi:hypothetical protein
MVTNVIGRNVNAPMKANAFPLTLIVSGVVLYLLGAATLFLAALTVFSGVFSLVVCYLDTP